MDVIFVGCCRHRRRHHHLHIFFFFAFLWVYFLFRIVSSFYCKTIQSVRACFFLVKFLLLKTHAWNVIIFYTPMHLKLLFFRISLALFNQVWMLCEYCCFCIGIAKVSETKYVWQIKSVCVSFSASLLCEKKRRSLFTICSQASAAYIFALNCRTLQKKTVFCTMNF